MVADLVGLARRTRSLGAPIALMLAGAIAFQLCPVPRSAAQAMPDASAQRPYRDSDFLLPDLVPLPPTDLWIEYASPGPIRLLRFTNTIFNSGEGPLELWGSEGWYVGPQAAQQRLYTPAGSYEEMSIGGFEWHDAHAHWHFNRGFVSYDLWAVAPDGTLAHLAALSEKLTWCLVDTFPVGPYRDPVYFDCLPAYQGIAVGWADVYTSDLDGQTLDVTDVPDGVYAVRAVANPDRLIFESDYANNVAVTYVQLDAGSVAILEPPSAVQ